MGGLMTGWLEGCEAGGCGGGGVPSRWGTPCTASLPPCMYYQVDTEEGGHLTVPLTLNHTLSHLDQEAGRARMGGCSRPDDVGVVTDDLSERKHTIVNSPDPPLSSSSSPSIPPPPPPSTPPPPPQQHLPSAEHRVQHRKAHDRLRRQWDRNTARRRGRLGRGLPGHENTHTCRREEGEKQRRKKEGRKEGRKDGDEWGSLNPDLPRSLPNCA